MLKERQNEAWAMMEKGRNFGEGEKGKQAGVL